MQVGERGKRSTVKASDHHACGYACLDGSEEERMEQGKRSMYGMRLLQERIAPAGMHCWIRRRELKQRGEPSAKTRLANQEREREQEAPRGGREGAARGAVQRHTTAPSIDVGVGRGEGINQTDHACGGYACVSGSEAERMGREKEVGIP